MNAKTYYIGSNENPAKAYSNANLFNEEKIRYAKEVISKELSDGSINKHNIDTELFNKCSRDFIETEKGVYVHNVKSEVTSFEISHLKNQNLLLRQLIAELSNENQILKGKLLKNNSAKI